MPTLYVDTSALLKRYKREPGTEVMDEVFNDRREDEEFVTSHITYIEGYGLLRRLVNDRRISQETFYTLLGNITEDLRTMTIYKVSDPILSDATEYAREYGLALGDAIHLATATRARGHGFDQPIVLLASDRRLKNVGREMGFSILDPEDTDTQTKLRSLRSL